MSGLGHCFENGYCQTCHKSKEFIETLDTANRFVCDQADLFQDDTDDFEIQPIIVQM